MDYYIDMHAVLHAFKMLIYKFVIYTNIYCNFIDGNLEVKLPTLWTDEKQRWEEAEKKVRRESQRRKSKINEEKGRENQKKEDPG